MGPDDLFNKNKFDHLSFDGETGEFLKINLEKVEKILKLQIAISTTTATPVYNPDGKINVNKTFCRRGRAIIYQKSNPPFGSLEKFFDSLDDCKKVKQISRDEEGQIIIHADDEEYYQYREIRVKHHAKELGFDNVLDPALLADPEKLITIRHKAILDAIDKFGTVNRG